MDLSQRDAFWMPDEMNPSDVHNQYLQEDIPYESLKWGSCISGPAESGDQTT